MRDSFEYRRALVVYLDILGFRELINQSVNDHHKVYEIEKVLEMIKEQMSEGRDPLPPPEGHELPESVFRSFNFSDLTVRVTCIDRGEKLVNILNNELRTLAEKQCQLLCRHGLLLRGGICIGQISLETENYFDDDI